MVLKPEFLTLVYNTVTIALLSSGIIMVISLIIANYVRIQGGFEKISKKFYEASKTLGKSTTKTFFIVDIPMLEPAIISGLALVFVDIVKELPLALLLRPFNFNTLATQVFVYANDKLIIRASIPSLIIIATALIGILTIYKAADKEG